MSNVVFILDIDSTIANNDHRATLLDKECVVCLTKLGPEHRPHCPTCGGMDHRITQTSWDLFLDPEVVRLDTPIAKAQEFVKRARELGFELHFITGRNSGLRLVTVDWLTQYMGLHACERVMMRTELDKDTSASEYKERALKRLIQEEELQDCKFIFFEDDPYVFKMYQKYGIVVKCPEAWNFFMPAPETGHEPTWRR